MKAKMSKLSLSVKPLLVIVFLCCMQTVSAFNYMTGNYTVTVQSKGTGAGKVYSTSSWSMWDNKDPNNTNQQYSGNSNKEVELLSAGTSKTLDMTTGSKYVSGWDNPSVRFSNVTLTADNYPGSTFDGWEASYGTVEGETLKLPNGEQITTQQSQSSTPELNSKKDVIIYAIFTAKTYYACARTRVEVVTVGADGTVLDDGLVGGTTPIFTLSGNAPSGITMGTRTDLGNEVFSQTADNYGKNAKASFMWDITNIIAEPFHIYRGCKATEGNYLENLQTGTTYTAETQSESAANLTENTIYVVYQRDRFNLLPYNAENDAFDSNPITPDNITNNVYYYIDNSTSNKGERLYRIISGVSGALSVVSTGDFSAVIEEINGMQVLRVNPMSNANELVGTITISAGNNSLAVLSVKQSNTPIYVTLNPAEDLTGWYEYTQNTTGDKTFSVTTSAISKQMTTSTDYFFTFTPIPYDATKNRFEKWVIKDAEGNVKEEITTANLSYRFNADESITPVFTSLGGATYIVKSEPSITYYDLQEALDRADALTTSTGKAQYVVVTSTTGKLLQGNYTIRNGVTLLIPGESTYTPMVGNPSANNYAETGTFSTYCTLAVEDNTTITVENGNISIYAKLSEINTDIVSKKIGVVFEHGHLLLGKNCQITVEKGDIYSYGFITGDKSSHITLEDSTALHEPFHVTDWRGGSETIGNWFPEIWLMGGDAGKKARVFPIGQYYMQSVEVPITWKAGAALMLSCRVDATAKANAAVPLIDDYDTDACLFGLGENTTVTRTYDVETDRMKYECKGNGLGTQMKMGSVNLTLHILGQDISVASKDYVMPIQNNLDIEVENVTLNVHYDAAFLPGATLRVHEDAVINIGTEDAYKPNVYVYDRGARKLKDGSAYWISGTDTKPIAPVATTFRPGGIQYSRADADLVDAQLIVNGSMNIYGGLYTVKGAFADEDTEEPEGGADITSEGSGKINVYSLGDASITVAKQWKQGSGAQDLALTSPKLILHNDLSAGADSAYTHATQENGSYTYYQHDGMWRLPQAGITSIKLYDNEGNEIDSILVTLPTTTEVQGYFLATLEQTGVTYNATDFTTTISSGNITLLGGNTIEDGKLKIPVKYTTQKKHGKYTQTLTVKYAQCTDCDVVMPVLAVEDYTPVFEVPSELDIYARALQTASGALPIKYTSDNVVTVTNPTANPTNPRWNTTFTNNGANYFAFNLGTTGNGLDGANIAFTPTTSDTISSTLTLTAIYTDANGAQISSQPHTVTLNGYGLKVDNILDFNNVGTIYTTSAPFDLLTNIISTGEISYEIIDGDASVLTIEKQGTAPNGNYTITPKKVGSVTIKVTQEATTTHTDREITKTIVVVANPSSLEDASCADNITNFQTLTLDMENVTYDETDNEIQFTGNESSLSKWIAQFSSMPGTLTFTPHGDGYWAVQESQDGINWSEIIWWSQLPSGQEQVIPLTPTSRRVQISYSRITEQGTITNLCINPFTIHAETTKLYVPVVNGVIQSTSVVFTHAEPTVENVRIEISNITGIDQANITNPTITQTTSGNKGGVLNKYYQTTVTISGGTNIPEFNNCFNLILPQGDDEAVVQLATYAFPKPLPMTAADWTSDSIDNNNINGYDEAEYYYHYMVDAKNVKWDAARKNVVFLNTGSKVGEDAVRQIVFGYAGLPDLVRFESAATEWTIEQSTDGNTWNSVDPAGLSITTNGDVHSIIQTIAETSQYVRITYSGTQQAEVLISNLVIEGLPSAVPDVTDLEITKGDDPAAEAANTFNIQVRNLPSMKLLLDRTDIFEMYYQNSSSEWVQFRNSDELTASHDADLAVNKQGHVAIKVVWNAQHILDEGYIHIVNPNQNDSVMAIVRLIGKKGVITSDNTATGIWTGVPDGNPYGTTKVAHTLVDEKDIFVDYTYHQVNLAKAFDTNKKTLFDYLIIFGETTTTDNTIAITQPTKDVGSNAKTPYYVYKKNANSNGYEFVNAIANANSAEKGFDGEVIVKDSVTHIDVPNIGNQTVDSLRIYITGFCPYASTGYTKNEEGVFLFRGEHGDKLHIYLEDCHIYSRNKTIKGSTFYGDKEGGETYSENYARGSGGVLVFENIDAQEELNLYDPFEVSIHTRGNNLLNSNHGCFYGLAIDTDIAMKAYQVSSPIQVHMQKDGYERKTKTTLNFDDLWPTTVNNNNEITATTPTNGFLALKKQANNAPSIDLGNQYTTVNFKGGRIELQNSQIGSDTYKTTLAISYRSGLFGAEGAGIKLCHGIGTDAVDGEVNFIDGTVTVEPMKVDAAYRQYYLMDTLPDGTETEYTSCLRTPKNTFVSGGSICRVRACLNVTSKGGAPKDKPNGSLLGQYVYTKQAGDTDKPDGTVQITGFPSNIAGLESYTYGLNSVTPDAENKFYFWIPDGFGGVSAEKDMYMATWKACMTKISAGLPGVAEGSVGGDTEMSADEEVKYFLYCQLDQNIYDVINAGPVVDGKKKYTYQAPIEVPSAAREFFKGDYTRWAPNKVGEQLQHEVISDATYTIANRVYYITTATADIWKTFTAPFDVANIYVVETFSEERLENMGTRTQILQEQAKHNADFAAFFGVAMAMGTDKSFEQIYDSYIKWAKMIDQDSLFIYKPAQDGAYTLRGKQKLVPYFGNNWRDANFYLNRNNGNWTLIDEDEFEVKWEMLSQSDTIGGTLLRKGETYSLMFPYCTSCETSLDDRDYWDYWSGKFLIFESVEGLQTINGSDFLNTTVADNVFTQERGENEVVVTGNSTFANLNAEGKDIYVYNSANPYLNSEYFGPVAGEDNKVVSPTTAFLYGDVPANAQGMPARRIMRTGEIIYDQNPDEDDNDNTQTGIPTIGGGNDLYITSIAGGINIAVAAPQYVRVISSTGALLFQGKVQTSVDVALPTAGVYVIAGETEAHKILY